MASHARRRADTRGRLLDAAADLFAERGIDGATLDAIAEQADRTSGAIYDHFGSKDGLLFALLDGWVDDVAHVIGAELSAMSASSTLEEWLGVLWRNVSSSVVGGRWIALEHELWSHAARNPDARDHLARRYRGAWRGISTALGRYVDDPGDAGAALIGVLFGLEMMRRVDPEAIIDDVALGALRGVVAAAAQPTTTSRPATTRTTSIKNTASRTRTKDHAHADANL